MNDIKLLLFDAANTLIHKPMLWERMLIALKKNNIEVSNSELQKHHKLVSELMFFPDRTSAAFYKTFNSELLYSLGIIPTSQLLDDIFNSCTYLHWEAFEDTKALYDIPLPKAIVSNFNNTLAEKISGMFPGLFSQVITSEEAGCAKPSTKFYAHVLNSVIEKPGNILYIGDSLKLDVEPALAAGMNACLIDRIDVYPYCKDMITSLHQLHKQLNGKY